MAKVKDLAKTQSKAGRVLLERAAREHYGLTDTRVELHKKKPQFVASDLCFSISHSKDLVAVCFDKNPVGFDIENITLLRNLGGLAKRYGLKTGDPIEFYKFWCGYEAKFKLGQDALFVKSFHISDDYMAAVASMTEIESELKIIRY